MLNILPSIFFDTPLITFAVLSFFTNRASCIKERKGRGTPLFRGLYNSFQFRSARKLGRMA